MHKPQKAAKQLFVRMIIQYQFMPTNYQPWASECPDVKNYKWWLDPVWHRMLYSCTRMATVSVKGLNWL